MTARVIGIVIRRRSADGFVFERHRMERAVLEVGLERMTPQT